MSTVATSSCPLAVSEQSAPLHERRYGVDVLVTRATRAPRRSVF